MEVLSNLEELEKKRIESVKIPRTEEHLAKIKNVIFDNLKQGFLNKNTLIFLDLKTEKFTLYDIKEDKIVRLMNKSILENLVYENYNFKMGISLFACFIPVVNFVFLPNKPKFFKKNMNKYFNLFRENEILATRHIIKKEDRLKELNFSKYPNIKILLDNLFPTKEYLNYFINWLSAIANTLEKNRTAIILKGIQGTGKGLLSELIIQHLFNFDNCITIGNDTLMSRFNEELENILFVFANEIKGNFKDGNTSFEKLKMWITDKEILIEGKNLKPKKIQNFFNLMIFSNNDTPLQIQPSDRRYTAITTKNFKIDDVVGVEKMDNFMTNIKKERKAFLLDLIKFDYSNYKASQVLENDDKTAIVEASIPKIELLASWLKDGDIERIKEGIKDLVNYTTKEIFDIFNIDDNSYNIGIMIENLLVEIDDSFESGFLDNALAITLYKIFVNHQDTSRKIGGYLNSAIGKVCGKRIKGIYFKGRTIKETADIF